MSKFVSIIIPCRNEEPYIGACLDSILKQTYPKDSMEILIADGMSTDKTRNILKEYEIKYPFIHFFDNPRRIVSTGLNILLRIVKGEVVMRMDAHAVYPENYIEICVKYLFEENVDNVGAVWVTLPGAETPVAKAIAIGLTSRFGVGKASYRIGYKEPRLVDTVPFGCFKRDVFDRIGLFDEELVRNQDDEFNGRLIKNGGKVLLVPGIIIKYYARTSYLKLWRMYFQYGYFKPLTVLKLGKVMTWRQLIPPLFIGSLAVFGILSLFNVLFLDILLFDAGLYMLTNALASVRSCLRGGGILLFPYLFSAFVFIHFGYGLGYFKGILDFVFLKINLKDRVKDMALSR